MINSKIAYRYFFVFVVFSFFFKIFASFKISRDDIFTPNNSNISQAYVWNDEWSNLKITEYNNYYTTHFPDAEYIAPTSKNYSCHGYAWYMHPNNPNDKVNIPHDAESTYWKDKSYVKVDSFVNDGIKEIVIKNAKILYKSDAGIYGIQYHSGVTGLDPTWITSKWGEQGPLMKHHLRHCPYDNNLEPFYPMIALNYVTYIRAAKITKFDEEIIPEDNFLSNPKNIVIGEKLPIEIKFDNPTENINSKIKKVELFYKKKDTEEYNLITTLIGSTGEPYTYNWETKNSNLEAGNYIFKTKIEYNNDNYNIISTDSIFLEFISPLKIESPSDDDWIIKKDNKEKYYLTDTLDIKVMVKKINDVYPAIKIKVHGEEISEENIVLNDSIYTCKYDLNNITISGEFEEIDIIASIDDNSNIPTENQISVNITNPIFYEDFETIEQFGDDNEVDGWIREKIGEFPVNPYSKPWFMAMNPLNNEERCCYSLVASNLTSHRYKLYSPEITLPDVSEYDLKLNFKIYMKSINYAYGNFDFYICDINGNELSGPITLPFFNENWFDYNFIDLNPYANQIIKLRWDNWHAGYELNQMPRFAIDDVIVFKIPKGNSSSINENNIIKNIELFQNYPNPFNPTTTIKFYLNSAKNIQLVIFNSKGEIVKTLMNKHLNKGFYNINFDGNNFCSGIYYYSLITRDKNITKKMILIK